jgi:hypothetical protein
MDKLLLSQAIAQQAEEKRAKAEAQKARAKETKRAAAARGFTVKPKYEFRPALGAFVEIQPRASNPRRLEIDGSLVSWPELAGKYSAPCMRKAGEVWREAKKHYGLELEEAEQYAKSHYYDYTSGRFYSWPEFLNKEFRDGRTAAQAEVAWKARGLRVPRLAAARKSPLDAGEQARIGALGTGKTASAPPRKAPKAQKPPVRGAFATGSSMAPAEVMLPPITGKSPSVRFQDLPPAASEGVVPLPRRRERKQPKPKSPVVQPAFVPQEETGFPWESPPMSPGGTIQALESGGGAVIFGFGSPKVGSSGSSRSSRPRSEAGTPNWAVYAAPPLDLSGAERNPAVDFAISLVIPAKKLEHLFGAWRYDGKIRVPWRDYIFSDDLMEFRGVALNEEDDEVLSQLYWGGWKPRKVGDLFLAKVDEEGIITLEKDAIREAPYVYLSFLEGFWFEYKKLFKTLSAEAKQAFPFPPYGPRGSLPKYAVEQIQGINRTINVFSPEFWEQPPGSKEQAWSYWARRYVQGTDIARDFFNSLRLARRL